MFKNFLWKLSGYKTYALGIILLALNWYFFSKDNFSFGMAWLVTVLILLIMVLRSTLEIIKKELGRIVQCFLRR